MAQVINTNIASLNAQTQPELVAVGAATSPCSACRRACASTAPRTTPPASAISTRFTAQINGLNQAARNANDGISLAQTAEGALDEHHQQPAADPRARGAGAQCDQQPDRPRSRWTPKRSALKAEIDRVAIDHVVQRRQAPRRHASATPAFQVGANVGETITISDLVNAQSAALGTSTVAQVTGAAASAFTAITAGDLTINTVSVGAIAARR